MITHTVAFSWLVSQKKPTYSLELCQGYSPKGEEDVMPAGMADGVFRLTQIGLHLKRYPAALGSLASQFEAPEVLNGKRRQPHSGICVDSKIISALHANAVTE